MNVNPDRKYARLPWDESEETQEYFEEQVKKLPRCGNVRPLKSKMEGVVRKFLTKHFETCRHKRADTNVLPATPWKIVHRKGWAGHTILSADGREIFMGQSTLEVCQLIVGLVNGLHDPKDPHLENLDVSSIKGARIGTYYEADVD